MIGAGIGGGGGNAHNLFLETLAEGGLVALAFLCVSVGCAFVSAWHPSAGLRRARLGVALFVCSFVEAMFSGQLQTNATLWFALGLLVTSQGRHAQGARSDTRVRPVGMVAPQ